MFHGFNEAVVVDVETTGLPDYYDNEGHHRVIEIAALRVRFENLITSADFHYEHKYYLVDPERRSSDGAFRKHGIDRSDVEGKCPFFADVAQEFRAFIGDSPIIAHKVAFDAGFLDYEFARSGVNTLANNRKFCTMQRFSDLYPIENMSLENAAATIGILGRDGDLHGAFEDTRIALGLACEFYMTDNNISEQQKVRNRTLLRNVDHDIRYLYPRRKG